MRMVHRPQAPHTGPRTRDRWRGRRLAVAACALTGLTATGVTMVAATDGAGDASRAVAVRDAEGDVLTRVPLDRGRFAVSYRNSVYGTLAEERYTVSDDGRFQLVQLAADQLAVLEEYYAVPDPPQRAPEGDRRTWVVAPHPDRPAVFTRLSIAASDLGERTLLVPGSPPVALWQLVTDNPTVVLSIEEAP